jgi:hypothetical protein
MFYISNGVALNAAAGKMWEWEQTGRTNKDLYKEAENQIAEYCEYHKAPEIAEVLLDAIQITVRIANGFPPDTGTRDW